MCNGDGRSNERPHRNHSHHHHNGNSNGHDHHHKHKQSSLHCSNKTKNDTNVNGNIYENDEELSSECERMINGNSINYQGVNEADRHSECCSSAEDGDNDTCCSCSESSCVYTEAVDPVHSTDEKVA